MYTFKIYYRVNGAKRRRVMELILDCDTLLEAWAVALDRAIVYTHRNEILDAIRQEVSN